MASRRFLPLIAIAVIALAQAPSKTVPKKSTPAAPRNAAVISDQQQARLWMRKLTLNDKIAQLIVMPFYGDNPNIRSRAYKKFATEVGTLHIGGLILVNRVVGGIAQTAEPTTSAAFLNRMQKLARIPLIVGGDFERGSSMRVNGPAKFPHSMAFAAAKDIEGSRQLGAATARESRAIGVHWVFAPVADVNNNPENPIINIRAFSEDPQQVAQHVKAFIEGARSDAHNRVLVTVKHFPGHGNTAVDTHAGLGKIEATSEGLRGMELVPFRAALEAHVDSIMTGHLWVPSLEPEEIPATVSAKVLSGLLRKELGFRGLITTDAMDMLGLSKRFRPGEAAVRSLEAGADVLLMPPNPQEAIRAVAAAVRSGRLSVKRIDESVEKLLTAKAQLGLHRKRLVELESISDSLDLDEDEDLARRVSERAVTLIRNEGNVVPLANADKSCWFVLSEARLSQQGRQMMDTLSSRLPEASRKLLDPVSVRAELGELSKNIEPCSSFVVAAFAGFKGNGMLNEDYTALIQSLIGTGKQVVLAGMGNPYLIRGYDRVPAFVAAFSTVPASEVAVVKALVGDIPIQGKTPVSIPGIAPVGAGIEIRPAAAGAGR
ncbi:MAG: hypothetical protein HY820_45065 [Acidobacteria bacterium]|nr:hypothetical protein [Acidobacteriota bacterium]